MPKTKNTISCKWVFTKKQESLDGDTVRYKAKFVAKDYIQQESIDYNEIFSPVVKHSPIQILLALLAQYELVLILRKDELPDNTSTGLNNV